MQTVRKQIMVFYHFQLSFSQEQNVAVYLGESESPTVQDILSILPQGISQGAYHFRFKTMTNEGNERIVAWADIDNIIDKAPQINGLIFIKILRIKESKQRKFNRPTLISNPANQPLVTQFPGSQQSTIDQVPQIIQPVATKPPSLIEFVNPPNQKSPVSLKDQSTNISSLSQQQIENRIKKWGYADGKRINNLITLLSTLHQIWPEWQRVPLTDLLRPELVNSVFKKAVLKVHPDKNTHRHFKEKYLSKQIFQLLNQSRKQIV